MKAAHEFFEREKDRCEIKQKSREKPHVEALSSVDDSTLDKQLPHDESHIHNNDAENVYDEHNGFYDFVSQINFHSKNIKSYPAFVMEAT